MRRSELKSILMESPLYDGEKDIDEVVQRNGLKLESGITCFFERFFETVAKALVTKILVIGAALYFVAHIIVYLLR